MGKMIKCGLYNKKKTMRFCPPRTSSGHVRFDVAGVLEESSGAVGEKVRIYERASFGGALPGQPVGDLKAPA